MIIVKNTKLIKALTFGFAKGLTIYPFIFVKTNPDEQTIIHEKIHLNQQREMLFLPFFLLYLGEWIFKGYKHISFEREAYQNDLNDIYLTTRKHYSFFKYF